MIKEAITTQTVRVNQPVLDSVRSRPPSRRVKQEQGLVAKEVAVEAVSMTTSKGIINLVLLISITKPTYLSHFSSQNFSTIAI